MLNPNFVIVGVIISSLGTLSYLVDTVKGRVRPNRVSFFLWSIAPLIAFFAEVTQNVGIQSLLTFSAGFLPLLVFIASFINKKAEWKLTKFDLLCGLISIFGLIVWLLTKQGNIAIFFSIVADGFAAIPTVVKSYKYPETESIWPWLGTFVGSLITLLTINLWSFANFGFPLYLFIVNAIIFLLVQFKVGKSFTKS